MPALKATEFTAKIVWLGLVHDRDAALNSGAAESLDLTFAGPSGEDHGGLTRKSCSRVAQQYPKGTEIRNTRQLSIVSSEELAEIAEAMGLPTIEPAWIGATVVIRGLSDFTRIPPSSRLQAPSGATITVDMENRACNLPEAAIERVEPRKGRYFKQAATGRRGVTAWVEREGRVHIGDMLTLHVPDQRPWQPE